MNVLYDFADEFLSVAVADDSTLLISNIDQRKI